MTRSYDVMIDRRGWAQAKSRPSWRPSELGRTRRGLPWTSAEDRARLRRVANADSIGYADPTMQAAAVALGRSLCSIATRLCSLRAGIRLAMAAKSAGTSAKKTTKTAPKKKGN